MINEFQFCNTYNYRRLFLSVAFYEATLSPALVGFTKRVYTVTRRKLPYLTQLRRGVPPRVISTWNMSELRAIILSDKYRLPLPTATTPRVWAVGWVGYVDMISSRWALATVVSYSTISSRSGYVHLSCQRVKRLCSAKETWLSRLLLLLSPYYYYYYHHYLLYAGYLYLYSWDKLCP